MGGIKGRAGLRSYWPRWQYTTALTGILTAGGAAAVKAWPHAWWWLLLVTVAADAAVPPALAAVTGGSQQRLAATEPPGRHCRALWGHGFPWSATPAWLRKPRRMSWDSPT